MAEKSKEQYVIDLFAEYCNRFVELTTSDEHDHQMLFAVLNMLTANEWSKNTWKLLREESPKYTDTYLVVVGVNYSGEGMAWEVRTADYHAVYKTFNVHKGNSDELIGEVIYWMPAPVKPKQW